MSRRRPVSRLQLLRALRRLEQQVEHVTDLACECSDPAIGFGSPVWTSLLQAFYSSWHARHVFEYTDQYPKSRRGGAK